MAVMTVPVQPRFQLRYASGQGLDLPAQLGQVRLQLLHQRLSPPPPARPRTRRGFLHGSTC